MFDSLKKAIRIYKDSKSQDKEKIKVKRSADELDFLPAAVEILESPPSKFAHILMLVICLFFIISLLWSWFSFIETEAVATGKVVPVGKVKNIQSLVLGRVEEILVKEGEYVKEGQLLIKLDPTESEVDIQQVTAQLLQNELSYARLTLLLDASNSHETGTPNLRQWIRTRGNPTLLQDISPSAEEWVRQQKLLDYDFLSFLSKDHALLEEIKQKKASINAINAEIRRLNILDPLHKSNEQAIHSLMEQGHVSRVDWLNAKEKQVDFSQQLEVQKSRRVEALATLSASQSEHDSFHKEFRQARMERLNEHSDKIEELKLSFIKAKEHDQNSYITAPVSGTVQQLSVFSDGSVVQPGSTLLNIIPDGSILEIEAMVENKDIGFIQKGMPVDIKFEAFPYTYFGYLKGEVTQISTDSVDAKEMGMVYPVYIKLDRDSLNVNGIEQPIRVGMSVTAELEIGDRRLLEYFMEPFFRYRNETLTER